jgi:DNA ligase-associated metallophosphoesterase
MIDAKQLQALVLSNTAIPHKFANTRLLVDGRGVLFWPQHDLLVFSDLHFEKGSFLTQFAHPMPRFDTKDTIKRMQMLITEYTPAHVICLGDSFHDGNADKRIAAEDVAAINRMTKQVHKWTWILGNHDPDIPAIVLGEKAHHLLLDCLLFVHEPEKLKDFSDCDAQVVGHYHPKTRYRLSNQKVTGKSFVIGDELLLMPAFGKYTGGLWSDNKAITALFDKSTPQIMLTYNKKLFML